jgi:hypothetical protein
MNDACAVHGGQTAGQLPQNGEGFLNRQRFPCPKSLAQGFTLQELHGQEKKARRWLVTMEDGVNRAKVRMRDFLTEQDFSFKATAPGRISGSVREYGLDGKVGTLQETIFYLIDLAHSSPGDQSDHHEPRSQHISGIELAGVCKGVRSICGSGDPVMDRACSGCLATAILVRSIQQGMFKEAPGEIVVTKELFNFMSKTGITAARIGEKEITLRVAEAQCTHKESLGAVLGVFHRSPLQSRTLAFPPRADAALD